MSKRISDEELLEDLKQVAEEIGESPTKEQYRQHGEYSTKTIQDRFPSWNQAKEQAGLPVHEYTGGEKASLEEIISELEKGKTLKQVAEKYGYASGDSGITAISQRLRRSGFKIRPRLSTGMRIAESHIEKLDLEESEDHYYDVEKFQEDGEQGFKIKVRENRVKKVDDKGEKTE